MSWPLFVSSFFYYKTNRIKLGGGGVLVDGRIDNQHIHYILLHQDNYYSLKLIWLLYQMDSKAGPTCVLC